MYLCISDCSKLDKIVKSFEVAYRSFVAEKVISNFSSEVSFQESLTKILTTFEPSSIMNSHKYHGKIKSIKGKYQDHFITLKNCFISYQNKDYVQHDVPYVSTIVDYVAIFFNPYFENSELLNGFSPIEFSNYSEKYYNLRNNLSHPASSKINTTEAKEVFLFIRRVQLNLNDKYFSSHRK